MTFMGTYIIPWETRWTQSERWVYTAEGDQVLEGRESSFFKKHIQTRVVFLILTPSSFIASVVDTIIGAGLGVASICTLGQHKWTYKSASRYLASSSYMLSHPYANLLKAINPNARLNLEKHDGLSVRYAYYISISISDKCKDSENFLMRHVINRLNYMLLAISCLITRAVDGIIGVVAVPVAFLTFGKFAIINQWAYQGLYATAIFYDLHHCIIKVINPYSTWQEDVKFDEDVSDNDRNLID